MRLNSKFRFLLFLGSIWKLSCAPVHKDVTLSDAEIANRDASADPHKEHMGMRINLTTNMATFYQDGKAIRSWKVATARDDQKSVTPEGRFRFHQLTTCVPWISTRKNATSAPCAGDNPLGFRAMWFLSAKYGLHGVDSSHLDSVQAKTASARRKSSGCVRNHPKDIEWLTNKVAGLYGTTPVQLSEAVKKKVTKYFSPVASGLALEVGRWDKDDPISASSSASSSPGKPNDDKSPPTEDDPVDSPAKVACDTDEVDAIINSPEAISVTDSHGRTIGKAKAFEIICVQPRSEDDRTMVYFPLPPAGFGWVPTDKIKKNCTKNDKWKNLKECWEAQQGKACLDLCGNRRAIPQQPTNEPQEAALPEPTSGPSPAPSPSPPPPPESPAPAAPAAPPTPPPPVLPPPKT